MQWFINQIVNNDAMFSRVNKITKKALCNYKKGRDYNTEKKKSNLQTCMVLQVPFNIFIAQRNRKTIRTVVKMKLAKIFSFSQLFYDFF